jgi:predicted nucleotidyltransferase component of viral defense system
MKPQLTRSSYAGRIYLDLQKQARCQGRSTDSLLLLYVFERFLYRVSVSPMRDHFILKGGMLLATLSLRRPTQDIDFLVRTLTNDTELILRAIKEIVAADAEDGVIFHTEKVHTKIIRVQDPYAGMRIIIPTSLASAKLKLQLDINFGDPVTPGAQPVTYPVLLAEHRPFTLLGYPLETVLAEKIETMLRRGDANTRWRDFADVLLLIRTHSIKADSLLLALRATAAYRKTPLVTFDQALKTLPERGRDRWATFRRTHHLDSAPQHFSDVIAALRVFVDPLMLGHNAGQMWDPRLSVWNFDQIR